MSAPARGIGRATTLEGIGLHSGLRVRLSLRPASPGEGLVFVREDLPGAPRLTLRDLWDEGPPFRTTLKRGPVEVHTVEHVLSATFGLGVTDLVIGLDTPELPALDGSALPFAEALREAGIVEVAQPPSAVRPGGTSRTGGCATNAEVLVVREPLAIAEGPARIVAEPWPEGLKVTYTLYYPGEPLAQGTLTVVVDPAAYLREIAPARTFCLYREAQALLAAGFGKGAGTHNTLVLDHGRVLEAALRFPDEPVRHKISDLLGDLQFLGRPLRAHLRADRSGHRLNRVLVRRLAALA